MYVYSNKGFRTLSQAQLLYDAAFYPDTPEAQQWIVYYISMPLVGMYESTPIRPAILPVTSQNTPTSGDGSGVSEASTDPESPPKKEIKTFSELLNHFPMIARQMQPGLERLFKEFGAEFEKPLPPIPPAKPASVRSRGSIASTEDGASLSRTLSNTSTLHAPSSIVLHEEEDAMRRALETAVTAAIDLFQMVDKQQLSLLGATTDLTGPLVERMIERYITEQVHDSILFPRICSVRKERDSDLDSKIRQMADIDVSQVGIPIEGGYLGKQALAARLQRAGQVFRKMGVAGSPSEMLDILLDTQKAITSPDANSDANDDKRPRSPGSRSEKSAGDLTINADTLVSMLLIVVIRSSVHRLQARLSYMRHFIFIDDVESGEMGYALSTFEAVLSYLAKNSAGPRKASKQNRRLWQATMSGDIKTLKSILQPSDPFEDEFALAEEPNETQDARASNHDREAFGENGVHFHTGKGIGESGTGPGPPVSNGEPSQQSSLSHIFPFQRPPTPPPDETPPKVKKKVSMASRHTSISSVYSSSGFSTRSRSFISDFTDLELEGDVSVETLSKTQGPGNGESVLMMAVESSQVGSLRYFLSLQDLYPYEFVTQNRDSEGATLLSAAVQYGDEDVIRVVLDYVMEHAPSSAAIVSYFALQDNKGRCVAHYLFNQPQLIETIGYKLPWRQKDKNGQTPLFAMSRSYDHDNYSWMVYNALEATRRQDSNGHVLHLDDHVDSKGNTLLHTICDPQVTATVLKTCDSDVNAANDKRFTPLMVASKYGRVDQVRALFGDPRVDFYAKDMRGFTAVELAKDDDVRNRIDDLVLLSCPPAADGRITAVVRSFFVDDATMRLVLKSGASSPDDTITVTTCRRSVADFQQLAQWLALEHPASWLPSIANLPSPFLIPTKPARSLLRDIQFRLDLFLKTLLTHPTFSTHELVWEFFLVPDLNLSTVAERSTRKAETRAENVKDEYETVPISDVRDVEAFIAHARDMVRGINHASRSVIRRVTALRMALSDLYSAQQMSATALSTLTFLPLPHIAAFSRFSKTLYQTEYAPLTHLYYSLDAQRGCTLALLDALSRPSALVSKMQTTSRAIEKHAGSLSRSTRFPFAAKAGGIGLFEDTRKAMVEESERKEAEKREELRGLGSELRYYQSTVASELSGWQTERERSVRALLREFASRMVVVERDRLDGMKRACRGLGTSVGENVRQGLGEGKGKGRI
ncbi:MAG: hypothetical protein M1820_000754 [Bogoriella megaspora]|nr:MAG: hypothetical protein M1820_000754 [Bogoriella megaspora]